jgi:hypothetical protein
MQKDAVAGVVKNGPEFLFRLSRQFLARAIRLFE